MSQTSKSLAGLSSQEKRALLAQLLQQQTGRPLEFPLSFAQERLWFLDQVEPGNPAYNLFYTLRLRAPLQVAALEQSFQEIQRRHDILRTTFPLVDGQPVQRVAPTCAVTLPVVDLRQIPNPQQRVEIRRLGRAAARRPFDLARGPLWRVTLLRLAEDEYVLLLCVHHIIFDRWSKGVFFRELWTLYSAFGRGERSPLPELTMQYADYALWQRQWLQGEVLEQLLSYWKQHLAGVPVLELPTDRPRPPVQTYREGRQSLVLSPDVGEGLTALSRREGVTLFMTLLAAFQALLYRYTGQDDISVGTFTANRDRAGTEGVIGFFVNNLVLRTDVSGNPRFRELLARVREVTLGAYAHQGVPFEKLLEELQPPRDLSHTPLFQVMLVLQNAPKSGLRPRDKTVKRDKIKGEGRSNFDVTLWMAERAKGLTASLEYNRDLFDVATASRMLRHFATLLEGIVADPEQRLSELPLLSEAERQQVLVEWNDTKMEWEKGRKREKGEKGTGMAPRLLSPFLPFSLSPTFPHLFEAQVWRTPEAVAVVCEEGHLSYGELNRRANQLAHYLQHLGVGPEARVGVCLERSLDLVIGLLGILKAGGAYVPLDPAYPRERLSWMVHDSHVGVVVTQQRLVDRVQTPDGPQTSNLTLSPTPTFTLVRLDAERARIAQQPDVNPDPGVEVENLAYVIYTSGSTGKPKGVMITHESLVNFTRAAQEAYGVGPEDRVLQFASISFDASAEEIYPCLSGGATLVLRTDRMLEALSFLQQSQEWGVTVLDLPTAFWHELTVGMAAASGRLPASVRLVIIGGERALPERLALWQKHVGAEVRVVNTYGPTEATVVATLADLGDSVPPRAARREVPIGRPIENAQVYVLDRHGQPVPIGVAGELHIGGLGLARGYLNRPELTAAAFIPHPFSQTAGARLYKSGDVVRYRPDGQLEFLGRMDDQVKVRGFRIELTEIEQALSQHPAVQEAVVLAREDEPGNTRLVAYVMAKPVGQWVNESMGQRVDESTSQRGNESMGSFPHFPISPLTPQTHLPADLWREWRSFLKGKLPEYMVPAAWVMLDELPRLPSGKVDRRALPAPDRGRPELGKSYVAPRTELERFLARLWQDILKIKNVGIHDNFFELGGNSLKGAVMVNQVQAALGAYVYVVAIFEAPTVADLAAYLSKHYGDAVVKQFGAASVDGRDTKPGPVSWDRAERVDAAKVARLRQLIRPLPPRPADVPALATKNPPMIFILTPPRSGSTLLRVMLGGHRRLFAPPELYLLLFNTLEGRKAARLRASNLGIWDGPVRAIMEIKGCDVDQAWSIMQECENQRLTVPQFYRRLQDWIGDRVLVDKSIFYAMNPDILRRAEEDFADAWYIHLIRHPLGMIRSFEEARLDRIMFRKQPFSVRQLAELIWVISHENILEFLKDIPAHRQHRVKFETLVSEPRAVMEELCQFLGLTFDPEMLQPYKDTKARMTDGVQGGARMVGDVKFHEHRGINAQVADRWRQYYQEDFLGEITWQLAARLGYEREPWGAPEARSTAQPLTPLQPLVQREEHLLAKLDQLSPEEVRSLLDKMLIEEAINQ